MTQNYVQSWKFLKEQTANVRDPLLRNAMMAEFRKRALNEWGFDPESGDLPTIDDVKKDDWEEEFVEDIAVAEKFNIDTREDKRKETEKQARASMRQMIRNGETLDDIPEDIRTPHIEKLFLGEMLNYADELIKCADDLIDKPKEL